MRLRNIPGADDVIAGCPYVIQDGKAMKGKHQEGFPCSQPIHIEIGMGKGRFLHELARQNPHINYIGIERYSSVLLRAIQKMEEEPVENLRFLCMDARELSEVFEEGEVDRIYLNFSDPWPKDRHAKRRLPSREFLNRYDSILKKEGRLEFKTDNKELFEFALEELPFANWKAEAVTYDLHNDEELCKGNIMTEYEERFSAKGNPIYKYIIYR
ncbi:MAG: tRNA (guanosine(46)-N7)-methyltransferase TrmB [Roseburia sp.]|nr:tRNA (guanosine(46)-N7)-methyltransferase TrmB [Roseburia sp.]MCM1279655.1 tRNA (guanosine(46)-N7)-methyltransferase TrmB [Robinsoniella sp.]